MDEEKKKRKAEYAKKYHQNNKEKIAEKNQKYRENNKKEIAKKKKEYYQNNKKEIAKQGKKNRERNKEKIAARGKKNRERDKEKIAARDRKYYRKNKEKIAERDKKYYQNNKVEIAQRDKKYRETHKEKIAQSKNKYYQENITKIAKQSKKYYQENKKGERYKCKECDHAFGDSRDLKIHLSNVHDIGDKECQYCISNVYTLINYKDKNEGKVKICKKCYNKMTGKDSRKETQMSYYLDEYFGREFLIVSDKRVYGEACQAYRPDKLYADPTTVIHIECDEFEHTRTNNNYKCDEKRISEIYDEFPGKNYVVIRWNPDNFKLPEGKIKLLREDRLKLLLDTMQYVQTLKFCEAECLFDTKITIIYMFYSKNNPLIAKNIKHYFVYNLSDLESFDG